jgi:predicted phage terminase large subunit-like protein
VWHLGQHPDHELVVASYGQELANDMSRDARGIRDAVLEEPRIGWPHLAPADKDGVEYWRIGAGGSYKAVGAGGPLTGRGAHALVIDDPLKNSEEADSETVRESRWAWYRSTAYTRLAPGGGILVMATRWHHDDLPGRCLEQLRKGEEAWRVVSFPAIAEEDETYRLAGEALHPERYPLPTLKQVRVVLGSRAWSALYQQRPTPDSGGLFQRAWLSHRYHHDPQRPPKPYDEIVVTCDATFKASKKADYVSIQTWGRYGWTKYHLLDRIHGRMSYVETRQALRDAATKWRPAAVLIEEKANGAALVDELRSEIPGVIPFVPDQYGDKVSRAHRATPMWEAGCVELPAGAPWVGDFVEEHAAFPLGAHDDDVDGGTQLFLWWAERRGSVDHGAAAEAMAGLLDAWG